MNVRFTTLVILPAGGSTGSRAYRQRLQRDNFQIRVDYFSQAQCLGKVKQLVQLGVDQPSVTADHANTDGRPLINVVVRHFRHGCVEIVADTRHNGFNDTPLCFQRVAVMNPENQAPGAHHHPCPTPLPVEFLPGNNSRSHRRP
ncbi:hypothetical protein DESC_770116 [Desulfosarcina cetonica]|nr:hypothetical protein DESC_770116 [Desulfosarcina cetonica]